MPTSPTATNRCGLSKQKLCIVVYIDSHKEPPAVARELGKSSSARIRKAISRISPSINSRSLYFYFEF